MRVLVACEFSGRVRDAFAAAGHDAVSCDLLPTESDGPHIVGDARDVLADGWDMLIAHPPCTHLCNSGVRWLHERNRWAELDAAAAMFLAFLHAPVPRVAVENPIMHGHALRRVGRRPDCIVHPYHFGLGERKATCWWLRGLPPLRPTHVVPGRRPRVHRESPAADRWKKRSITPTCMAEAMAAQWGV